MTSTRKALHQDWQAKVDRLRGRSPSCAVWVPRWLQLDLDDAVGECRLAEDSAETSGSTSDSEKVCKSTLTGLAIDCLARRVHMEVLSKATLPSWENLTDDEFLSRNTTITITRQLKNELDYFAPKLSRILRRPISAWHVLAIALAIYNSERESKTISSPRRKATTRTLEAEA